ncbi:putative tetratricopeptide-like helical domain superfamily, DYW domain-containing protein [Helianthus annuus]|uniref:Putative tetratricopeptide-like helical domain, DYW domain protein n=2 Tax=Helianthus annuus TaxID=4232 RepID=A0A251U4Z7_HELAN|nr:putative tetratricopeptide-like helical domain superfamily, DYW domain-containing protein [Helianthus annuus]KAJ0538341.1 putative tetratricopeptide-like helical domain superfamily, DYW domain-containing protein [Helianthus annuus]KAJ0546216.1 putative tetratricopeptide-like helical domain superfamily, DYW domain-containing protein [Helianthus annuus]KAJ0552972.1 putative tetratricopeptide-like helical domain superfamily, DYW domain-containing protein [Helianthus annuus]KAJ0718653.1 putative
MKILRQALTPCYWCHPSSFLSAESIFLSPRISYQYPIQITKQGKILAPTYCPLRLGGLYIPNLYYMNKLIVPFSENLIFVNGGFISTVRSIPNYLRFLSTSSTATPNASTSLLSEEEEAFDLTSHVIQEKDYLTKSPNGGLRVLDLIDQGVLEPDGKLYNQLLNKCTQLGKIKEGKLVHNHFLKSRFKHYMVIQNTALNMYAKCGCLDDARQVFDKMPVKDMVTWTAMITGYSQNEKPEEALVLFPEMLRAEMKPNHFTFSSLLKAAGARTDEREGEQIHGFCLKYGYDLNVYVGSALVELYCRYERMNEAHFVFDGLVDKNEVSWNSLIAAHARKSEGDKALRVFQRMQRHDFKPTHFTYSSIFSACASTGSLEQGKWIHAHMVKSGLKLIAFIGNTLLDMYAKSGSFDDAIRVFDRLVKPDVVSWNSMLTAYAQHGLGEKTLDHFEKMKKTGIEPNSVTFLCVLTACSHGGLLDKGQYYFELMKKVNIEPDVSHYVTMVDLLGRAGQLDHALNFINELPIKPTSAIWGALLGACRMHKNMELGAYAAERVFELDPYDSGPHILLYNIYASAGKWNEASKVRKFMKEIGVKKEPACSWVDIENSVHMFVANDDNHPMQNEINKMWGKISEKIKEIGYVPDTSHVLLYVDEQEREVKLQFHSEKLALAFALLKTPPGSTIRIKKNIRVCGDCHSAFKYASLVVEREIILRDTNRFHHFYRGSCSCGDYW